MIFRLIGMMIVTITMGLGVCVYAHFSNVRVVSNSEHALAGARANSYRLLRAKYSDQWPELEVLMNAQYGSEWTNELSGEQVITIQEAANDPLFTTVLSVEP